MKVKLNEGQCKACLVAVRCLSASVAVLLHNDEIGRPLMDRAAELLRKVGPDGVNLAEATLTPEEADTLSRALNAAHFIFVLSKVPVGIVPEDQRNSVLKDIRHCLSLFPN